MKKTSRLSSVSVAIRSSMSSLNIIETSKDSSLHGFTIKLANTLEEREAAFRLAYKVYRDKEYIKENPLKWLVKKYDANPETAILLVQNQDKKVIGTITIVFDGQEAIPAEAIYSNEIKLLRSRKEKIVEVSRLVIDPDHRNAKEILILLFNYLFIFSFYVKKYTCLTIEVNPRHKEYYRTLLCFDEIGIEKPCPNVQNAPAVLLYVSFMLGAKEVLRCANSNQDQKNRSLYPYFLKSNQEKLAAEYLAKQYKPISAEEKLYFGFAESGIGRAICV